MQARFPTYRALSLLIVTAGCAQSIRVRSPVVTQGNFSWRNQVQTSPVNLGFDFDARAQLGAASFKIELHDVFANACGANVIRDVRPDLQPPPVPGGSSAASEPLGDGDYCVRVYADMSPPQPFDGLGFDYFFTVLTPGGGGGGPGGGGGGGGGGGAPSFTLSLGGSGQTVHFGDSATLPVTLVPSGGFSDTVTLTSPVTSGGWAFNPSASINAGSGSLTRNLQGVVTPAQFIRGSNPIVVQGVAAQSRQQKTAAGTLVVAPAQGDFTHVYPQPQAPAAASSDCRDGTADVHIDYVSFGPNDFRVTFARTDLAGRPTTAATPAVFFLLSSHCRIGISLAGVGLQQSVTLYNLGFTGAPGWRIAQTHNLSANALRQQYWFNQDDSLMVIIRVIGQTPDAQLPPGAVPGTIFTYAASVLDPLTGQILGSEQQFMAMNLAADVKEMQAESLGMVFNSNQNGMLRDPDPDPNLQAPAIADIFKLELGRDASGALQAEGTYRIINGQLDGTTFDQEYGSHPDHFRKFVVRIP
jgi:hypothetical protein